jgi:hypothetical protein
MKFDLSTIINLAKGILLMFPQAPQQVHSAVQRALTVPAKDRAKLTAGMSADDKAQAEILFTRAADANADLVVFLASRGEIDPD